MGRRELALLRLRDTANKKESNSNHKHLHPKLNVYFSEKKEFQNHEVKIALKNLN